MTTTQPIQLASTRTGESLPLPTLPELPEGTPDFATVTILVLVLGEVAGGYTVALPQTPERSVFVPKYSVKSLDRSNPVATVFRPGVGDELRNCYRMGLSVKMYRMKKSYL